MSGGPRPVKRPFRKQTSNLNLSAEPFFQTSSNSQPYSQKSPSPSIMSSLPSRCLSNCQATFARSHTLSLPRSPSFPSVLLFHPFLGLRWDAGKTLATGPALSGVSRHDSCSPKLNCCCLDPYFFLPSSHMTLIRHHDKRAGCDAMHAQLADTDGRPTLHHTTTPAPRAAG